MDDRSSVSFYSSTHSRLYVPVSEPELVLSHGQDNDGNSQNDRESFTGLGRCDVHAFIPLGSASWHLCGFALTKCEMSRYQFHSNCGVNIKLSDDKRSAERRHTDFNNGLVFSEQSLVTNCIFQVRITKKVNAWSGGIEIGVTSRNPSLFNSDTLPRTASELKEGTWLMSGRTLVHNGEVGIDSYGYDLEKLNEGDTVGLTRTEKGCLIFFVNGTSQGVAALSIPKDVYCFVNLYGKCSQVTIMDVSSEQNTNTQERCGSGTSTYSILNADNNCEHDKLKFHERCGPLACLTCHNKVAERKRPMEEFNNAVVLTHRPLKANELFQIRIDLLIQKWSGSLEFGLTGNPPESFDLPATLTIVKNTLIMSGNGVLHNGKATSSHIPFNLDQLQEGDRIGVIYQTDGEVHYFVNGTDQGCAATGICEPVWGCVNLYGMAAKVTIVDRDEREEHNLRMSTRNQEGLGMEDILLFHPNCGLHTSVKNGGRTAFRPNAGDDFNHGVVITRRTLRSNELFEVRLDKIVAKWAGGIEIGITEHSPNHLEYPCTMTSVLTGTWIFTGSGIMHNGISIIDEYGKSLDRLKVRDTVGVMRTASGDLHFFVNGEDQGCAASGVPPAVYGVIDLYGSAAEASIVANNKGNSIHMSGHGIQASMNSLTTEPEASLMLPSIKRKVTGDSSSYDADNTDDLRFSSLCGKNSRVFNSNLSVSRSNPLGEFNAAIGISNKPLRDDELFEVVIERMVDRWSGNLECGVTSIKPDDLEWPNTMTDLDRDTWMLSGSNFMIGGSTVTHHYKCNLDELRVGDRVGVMRKSDSTLHFFVNGIDKGPAAHNIPSSVWAVFDLYGQVSQISIAKTADASLSSQIIESLNCTSSSDFDHKFSNCCGRNIVLKSNNLEATRIHHFNNALVFSSLPLELDKIFEVRLTELNMKWAGSIAFGITNLTVDDCLATATSIPHSISAILTDTWFITGNQVRKNNVVLQENYCPNLERLSMGDRVGLRISNDSCLHCYINGEDLGIAVQNLPKVPLLAVFDLHGQADTIKICSATRNFLSPDRNVVLDPAKHAQKLSRLGFETRFCGKNIEFSNNNATATRTSSYNHGLVFTNQVLLPNQIVRARITKINGNWTSSLMVGVICFNEVENVRIPSSARHLCQGCIVFGHSVIRNGYNINQSFGSNLDCLDEGSTVGVLLDSLQFLHIVVNGVDQGTVCKNLERECRVLFDLYGMCEEITLLPTEDQGLPDAMSSQLKIASIEKFRANESVMINCEYLNACIGFKETLCLPEPYFPASEPVICFCNVCSRGSNERSICEHGDPSAEFTVPLGWVRFPLDVNLDNSSMASSTSSFHNAIKSWHVAYYGTPISHVREVLDVGQLFPFDSAMESFREDFLQDKPSRQKDETAEGSTLFFSPCVEYASCPEFSAPYRYAEHKTGKKWEVKVAFQILVQPGSYKIGAASFPISPSPNSQYLKKFSNSIEWSTKEERATHISALLIRLDKVNIS